MAQNLETTLITDADRALYHTYGVAIRHAEAQIWGNPDLNVFTDVSTGASCVIAAPNPDLLLGVVRDARGLHVERHIEMAGSPCDSFTLTREGGTCWEYMASGEQVSYEVPALPRIVLGSILRRFTDPHPGRGGYLQFLIGKETEPVVQRLAERGHVLRHPMLTRALGEWGILASAY